MHIALERPAGLPEQQLEVHRFGQRRGAGGGDARHNRAATAIRFTMVAIIGMPVGPLSTAGASTSSSLISGGGEIELPYEASSPGGKER